VRRFVAWQLSKAAAEVLDAQVAATQELVTYLTAHGLKKRPAAKRAAPLPLGVNSRALNGVSASPTTPAALPDAVAGCGGGSGGSSGSPTWGGADGEGEGGAPNEPQASAGSAGPRGSSRKTRRTVGTTPDVRPCGALPSPSPLKRPTLDASPDEPPTPKYGAC
jgi:hypothetical protein